MEHMAGELMNYVFPNDAHAHWTLMIVIYPYITGVVAGAFIVSAFVSISSIFGDLFESSLKRKAGVKDSGDILPGHGGVLDRTDGYLFGAIVMLVLLRGLV